MFTLLKRGALLAVFCLIGIFFLTSEKALAQDPAPCQPDCFNDVFGATAIGGPYMLPCGQAIIVKYKTRKACGVWDDVYIESIEFVGGNAAATQCGLTMSMKDMVAEATRLLLTDNPMNFLPLNQGDPCNSNWRVMKGACWRASFATISSFVSDGKGSNDGILTTAGRLWPCDYNYCCLEMIQVCIIDGQRIVTELPGGTPGECKFNPTPDPNCTPVCD